MAAIVYYVKEYKLDKFIVKKNYEDYICISPNTYVNFIHKESAKGKAIEIDSRDFMKLDIFFVQKKIRANFEDYTKDNIVRLIKENYVDAIHYLIETNFHCAYSNQFLLMDYFIIACHVASIDIIMPLRTAIEPFMDKHAYILKEGLGTVFGTRDSDIITILLDNIPHEFIQCELCAKNAIENNRLSNYLLLAEKHEDFENMNYMEIAIVNGYIEILEYLVQQEYDLQEFIDNNIEVVIKCADNDHTEMVEYIFNKIEISKDQLDEFLRRAFRCKPEYIDLLIDAGANFVNFGEQLYKEAMLNNNIVLAKHLKKNYL